MSQILEVPKKALQWCRIGVAARRLRNAQADQRPEAEQILAKLMGEARGLTMKIGQLMAGSDDANLFQPLVNSVKALPLAEIVSVIERRTGRPINTLFKDLAESEAAASLGQVHRGHLLSGEDVAVKIRYPGIVASINAELKLSAWMPDGGPVKRWRFDSIDYKNTLRRQLLRETDYCVEKQTQQRFAEKLKVPGLVIPQIYPDQCDDALLVQSWEQGCRFNEACKWPKKDRLEIARTLLVTLFQSLFLHGEVHGDPHPGNYLFRHDDQGHTETVLLDYGCTVMVSKPCRLALLKLIHASQAGFAIDPLQCFVAMGFDAEKLGHIQDKMPALCRILLQPFLTQKPVNVHDWQISQELQELLAEQRWWFRAAGPADLLLLLRSFHGLKQQMQQLNVAIPWWPMLKFAVGTELLNQAQNIELAIVEGVTPNQCLPVKVSARKLCVRISEDNKITTNIALPAEAVLDLESIMPTSVLEQIHDDTGVDLIALTQNLQTDGVTPQLLNNSSQGNKDYRVWLE